MPGEMCAQPSHSATAGPPISSSGFRRPPSTKLGIRKPSKPEMSAPAPEEKSSASCWVSCSSWPANSLSVTVTSLPSAFIFSVKAGITLSFIQTAVAEFTPPSTQRQVTVSSVARTGVANAVAAASAASRERGRMCMGLPPVSIARFVPADCSRRLMALSVHTLSFLVNLCMIGVVAFVQVSAGGANPCGDGFCR